MVAAIATTPFDVNPESHAAAVGFANTAAAIATGLLNGQLLTPGSSITTLLVVAMGPRRRHRRGAGDGRVRTGDATVTGCRDDVRQPASATLFGQCARRLDDDWCDDGSPGERRPCEPPKYRSPTSNRCLAVAGHVTRTR